VTATALAQYLILRADAQDTVLHDSRFSHPSVSGKYAAAFRVLIDYNTDRRRAKDRLEAATRMLKERAKQSLIKRSAIEEFKRCIEVINLFEQFENKIGLRALPLEEAPKFQELNIEGTMLSIQPHFVIRPVSEPKKIGAAILRLAKAPDPNACRLDATRISRGEHRREMGRYMVAMMQMLLEEQPPFKAEIDRNLLFVADIRLGERIGAASDHVARLRAIRSACRQISRLWATVTPRPSIMRKPEGSN
jgi:hypothetical protein